MKKEKKKATKLDVKVNLKKPEKYHFVPELSNVFFPYQPYSQQIEIIKCIQKAIYNKQNALIQSPTGTGKTLCLIIGSLSALVDLECRKKVYYLTRTHSQISQVIDQFKKTVYDCNLNIIASREQFCLNYNISQLKGKQLEKACDELCIQKLCPFKQHTFNKIPPPMEVHLLRDYCKKQLVCPYYYSKQLTQRCQITILPFNYLLDWSLFEKNSLDLKDSIIIFDQAHNIDSLCQQGSDVRLNFDIVHQCINQLKTLIKLQSKRYLHKQFRQSEDQFKQAESIKQQLQYFLNSLKKSQQIVFLRRQEFLEKMQLFTNSSKQQGLDLGNYSYFCSRGRRVMKLCHKKEQVCENFRIMIDVIERIFTICNNSQQFSKFTVNLAKGQLLLRCLDPSICFKRLIDCKPRSVILSSGTMGNLQLWQKNLQVKFQEKIVTQSFITSNHLFATIRSKTQGGTPYNFSFQGKQSEKQFEQMCAELSKLQQIVQGGIVVAFSNYDLLEKSLKYANILKKKIFFETKGGNVDDIIKQYTSQVKQKGAFMFIIIKGRFSQGINFSDDLCRCLVVIGIPFLPLKNTGIMQKMKYLQQNYSKADSELWYAEQSFKSLNQTIGRAIRNSKDYAAIILMDQRYSKQENLKFLSKWFTKCIKQSKDLFKQIQIFYKAAISDLPSQSIKKQEDTKNKHETSLKDRLKQFSTPSKTNKKKLKILLQSEEKTSIMQPTALKQIKIQELEQTAYKNMDRQLANYFLSSKLSIFENQDFNEARITQAKVNQNMRMINIKVKSNRKCNDIIDF